jgi:hypothetical protein
MALRGEVVRGERKEGEAAVAAIQRVLQCIVDGEVAGDGGVVEEEALDVGLKWSLTMMAAAAEGLGWRV